MRILPIFVLISTIALSQSACLIIDPDDVEAFIRSKNPEVELMVIDSNKNQDTSMASIEAFSYLKTDSVFHAGKPECIHEWRNKSPERRCQLEYKSRQVKTYLIEDKTYIRVCAKCIRNEKIREQCWMKK